MNINQDEINKAILRISHEMKRIPNISYNYIDYISALIYVLYEYHECNFNTYDNVNEMVSFIDNKIEEIQLKENSKELFKEIRFKYIVNKQNFLLLQWIIANLNKIIRRICESEEDSRVIIYAAFEYLIMNAAKDNEIHFDNGEFYTPKGVIKTIIKLLNIKDNVSIYDPACGTGNFLAEASKRCKHISAYTERIGRGIFDICMTNLKLHNVNDVVIRENGIEKLPKVDFAISNPPFAGYINDENKELEELLYKFGVLHTSDTYEKFLVKMIDSLNEHGKLAVVLPHGILFKKADRYLRMELVERNLIDAIIGLPENLFYATRMSTIILIINMQKIGKEILFIDASKEYESKRKTNILTIDNQDKIANAYKEHKVIDNYSYIAGLDEIKNNDYDLSIKKYVRVKKEISNIDKEQIEKSIYELEKQRSEIQRKIDDIIWKFNRK